MDTRQKLASTHEMYLPKIVELLDMGETSLQKVIYFKQFFFKTFIIQFFFNLTRTHNWL